ncbi:DUF6448 family protein [Mycolicibacterium sp.]|jgi:hypothetical protein|uniref:DUF6448 family protein n=1 Tax=Mycolicibacterium sp. TaxID=2320850 RepID=UPI0028AED44D|nr:DUF6448 family protein [Mycolicibacterium sp.]
MPPHCDSLDGPVVKAARRALDSGDVDSVLPFVPQSAEDEIRAAFAAVSGVRDDSCDVRELADQHFFETVVRLHRAGEGAAFTGLKPAGLDHGPVIPVAERAIDTGSADDLVALLNQRVADEVRTRLHHVEELKAHAARAGATVEDKRAYVQAMLGLQVWAHTLFKATAAAAHENAHAHAGG